MSMICNTTNATHLVELFGLWSSRYRSTVTMSKGGHSRCSTKTSAVVFSKEAVADPTWQDIVCSDYVVVDNMVDMGNQQYIARIDMCAVYSQQ